MRITGNSTVANQNWSYVYSDSSYLVAVHLKVLQAATASLSVVLGWTDPDVGRVTRSTNIALAILNDYKADLFPVHAVAGTWVDVTCTVATILGTPSFAVELWGDYPQYSYFQ